MFVAGSTYWNMAYGQLPGDVTKDEEGISNMRNLGQNMAFLLKHLDFGHERTIRPDVDARANRQFLELLAHQRGEFLTKLVTIARKRLVDVLDQKNVPLA